MKIGIAVSEYNPEITSRLLDSCLKRLEELGVKQSSVAVVRVPGAFELPLAAQRLAAQKHFDAIITLGCVLQGQTDHHTLVAQGAAYGIQQVSLKFNIPIIFGVITPGSHKQALARSAGRTLNRGAEAAEAAVKMVKLMSELK